MAMLAMAILVHCWMVYWAIGCATYTHLKVLPAVLYCSLATYAHARLVRWQLWLLHGAFNVT